MDWIISPFLPKSKLILIKTIGIILFKSPFKKSKMCQYIMIGDLCFHYVLFHSIIPLFSSSICCCLVAKSCPTLCDLMDWSMPGSSLCLPLSPRVCSDSYPLSWWCYLTISSSTVLFSFCLHPPQHQGFSIESALHIRWPNYWGFNFSVFFKYDLTFYHLTFHYCLRKLLIPKNHLNIIYVFFLIDFFLEQFWN